MDVFDFILQIVLVLFVAKIAGQISLRLGQPSVLGKIIAGIVLGPAVLGWIEQTEIIHVFSEIGVLLLMFLAGMETDLESLNKNVKAATLVAVLGVIVPILMGWGAAPLFGLPTSEGVFLGLLLAATSVSISVQTLREIGWLNSKEGATLLGAAVLDDVVVVILIAVAIGFFMGTDTNIAWVIAQQIIFFIVIYIVGKYIVPKFMKLFGGMLVTEPIIAGALILLFAAAYFADFLGVSGIIGTYFMGVALSKTKYAQQIEHGISPIAYGIFVPFFFINIGLPMSFDGIGDQIIFILVFSVIAVLSKFIGCGLGAKVCGFSWKSSAGIGAGMISRGEVALILASIGLSGGILSEKIYGAMIVVIVVTTLVTPPLLKFIFGKRLEAEEV
ncbi:cation:proton antiporter [Ureibacillus sp. FSL K6-8385]|uniref:Cation:proton antiporter n=1 Tax=Ureibacillus terrenus TaxID=118246 RepID=A0A540V7M2_9BACL|nr:cation:proton antiporter [Ureibacillus terrenus]MED3660855.1 cation:proton antiporter [Ureibacillus terrenus]MED3764647.1 cation:proton antiporter [Ureibacillus terrenus]TQE92163.1 cation:proton antiporter [Ureibacillus terrenus]